MVLSAKVAQFIHSSFEWLGLAVGVQMYRLLRHRRGAPGIFETNTYVVMLACILGSAIGNKLVFWFEYPHLWATRAHDVAAWFSGQSIVGGLLGGLVGVEVAKRIVGISYSTGDDFVLPLMAGTIIGRIGCFLAGLHDATYGSATTLPWGVNFGDGVLRHPTQVYDMLFVALWGGWLWHQRAKLNSQSGLLFKGYLSGYLVWRLLVDSIKPVPYAYLWQWSGIQWVCLVALILYLPFVIHAVIRASIHWRIKNNG
ncbi:diacylglyceryl transferase [Chitinimonas sp. BJB300]|nr:diacylglyceryl transferase [Chitinimonas sp. BJB300]TSJ88259.1 prolipoprotein diacylglyceryl transferase [Chitinimonas sp. BJB300]